MEPVHIILVIKIVSKSWTSAKLSSFNRFQRTRGTSLTFKKALSNGTAHIDRQTDQETERQAGRQTDQQTDRQTDTNTQRHKDRRTTLLCINRTLLFNEIIITNVCSVTSEPSMSSSRCVPSFKDSLTLLNNWEVNFTNEVKYFYLLAHCLWWKPKIYIGTQWKCTKRWKQSSAINQLLATLFLAIKMYTGFTADGINMNTMYAVSLANHLRAVAKYIFDSHHEQCASD